MPFRILPDSLGNRGSFYRSISMFVYLFELLFYSHGTSTQLWDVISCEMCFMYNHTHVNNQSLCVRVGPGQALTSKRLTSNHDI